MSFALRNSPEISAARRATELGFRLENFRLHEPGMTPARLVEVLRARGIRGVLADFHRHCLTGEPVGIAGSANLSVMALCDATCRSATGRTTVTLA